jgi:hypothetical protein
MLGFLLGLSSLFSILSGFQGLRAGRDEADAQRREADLKRLEAEREADRTAKIRSAERAKRSMAYIKSGVTLDGSPLIILEAQREEDKEEVKAIRQRGLAFQRLGYRRAALSESRGRSALIGGLGQAVFTGASIF